MTINQTVKVVLGSSQGCTGQIIDTQPGAVLLSLETGMLYWFPIDFLEVTK